MTRILQEAGPPGLRPLARHLRRSLTPRALRKIERGWLGPKSFRC
jgi:hypothetical protein